MTFLPTIPQPNDELDTSQGQLLSNNGFLDTVFGINHYTFSNATANRGFHSVIVTPLDATFNGFAVNNGQPQTTATTTALYSFAPTGTSVPLIHFARQISNSLPNPIEPLSSGYTPFNMLGMTQVNVLNFSGIKTAIATLRVFSTLTNNIYVVADVSFTATGPITSVAILKQNPTTLTVQWSATTLQISNTSASAVNGLVYALTFSRLEIP